MEQTTLGDNFSKSSFLNGRLTVCKATNVQCVYLIHREVKVHLPKSVKT